MCKQSQQKEQQITRKKQFKKRYLLYLILFVSYVDPVTPHDPDPITPHDPDPDPSGIYFVGLNL